MIELETALEVEKKETTKQRLEIVEINKIIP